MGIESFNRAVNVIERQHSDDDADHGEAVSANPVKVALRSAFAHEEQDHRAAIQGRDGKQVEGPEQQVQLEKYEEYLRGKIEVARGGVEVKPALPGADAEREGREGHEQKIGSGSGQ